jgi:predicted phosphodiesterase
MGGSEDVGVVGSDSSGVGDGAGEEAAPSASGAIRMAAPPLSDDALQEAVEALIATQGHIVAAAKLLNISRGTFEHRARQAEMKGLVDIASLRASRHTAARVKTKPSPHLPVTADEAWEALDGWIGRKRVPKIKPPTWQAKATQRLCVAGDFHAPFHDPDVVATLIAEEGPRTDTLIVSGDLMDFYSISRFIKYEHVSIEQEIAGADALLGQLAAAFSDVLVVNGNHDVQRFEKQLRSFLSPDMVHVIELLTGGNLSVIHMLAKRYPNVRFAPQQAGVYKLGWMTQVGDLIVSHAEKFSTVPGSALRKIEEGLTDFDHVYGLQPWKVLIQAHTHAHSVVCWHADKLLLEGGCCCVTHGYQLTARMGGRPQRQGYTTLTQVSGVTDINSIKFRWLNAAKKLA